jgi:hypothetical protein
MKSAGRSGSPTPVSASSGAIAPASMIEQQATRFVAGRAFHQNGSEWIDNQVQKMSNATTNTIQFNSPEYFEFAAKNPSLNSVLSLGSNVQFVHNGQIISVR